MSTDDDKRREFRGKIREGEVIHTMLRSVHRAAWDDESALRFVASLSPRERECLILVSSREALCEEPGGVSRLFLGMCERVLLDRIAERRAA